ncbi:MAG: glycosyltransferase [Bacilli bacterium]|nr:glycosyltransferase [Bacilli bacterium]
MKIVFVLECCNAITNGTGATCYRFAQELKKKGHEIIMLGEKLKPDQKSDFTYYGLPHYTFPIFEGLITKDGFNFVKCDPKIIYEAIKGADLVHLFIPFKLCSVARLIAEVLDVPVSCAFHLQPQNITSAIHCGKLPILNNILYYSFRRYLFDHVRHVHCPSWMIRSELVAHNYRNNEFHVISNGIIPYFHRVESEKPSEYADKIVVTMSGRLAPEKRQDLIIKAIAKSKYNSRIQLVLCGKGPWEKHLLKLAEKKGLANGIVIKFCNQEQLRDVLCHTDIYVHASDFEIEGISAIEAIACGAVPVISDAKASATSSFSLSPRCLFRHGSAHSLREGIEYFIEHPKEREKLSKAYEREGNSYHLARMVEKMEQMFSSAIEDHKAGLDVNQNRVRKKDERKKKKIFKKLLKSGVISEMPGCLKD